MKRTPKARGTDFEATLLPLIQSYWPDATRRPTEGRHDKGDFAMPGNAIYIVEGKAGKALDLPGWWSETETEALNAGTPFGVLVHKRRGKSAPEEQWATMTFGKWLGLVHRS